MPTDADATGVLIVRRESVVRLYLLDDEGDRAELRADLFARHDGVDEPFADGMWLVPDAGGPLAVYARTVAPGRVEFRVRSTGAPVLTIEQPGGD